jgi:hypothetical protein
MCSEIGITGGAIFVWNSPPEMGNALGKSFSFTIVT